MDYKKFESLAKDYNLIPVYEFITADMLTPVTAYLKIREKGKCNFLLESVENAENLSRYSFIGKDPAFVFSNKGKLINIREGKNKKEKSESIFDFIRKEIKKYNQAKLENLPDFTGGIVGYLGYENIELITKLVKK